MAEFVHDKLCLSACALSFLQGVNCTYMRRAAIYTDGIATVVHRVYPFTGLEYWNGLLDWNTGTDYWTELFSFFG